MGDLLKSLAEASPGLLGGLITAVIGFFGGVVGAITTPLAQWGVEKRRRRQDRQRELIRAVREAVEREEHGELTDFIDTAIYSAIRPYLQPAIVSEIERKQGVTIIADPEGKAPRRGRTLKNVVLDEMARLEQKWKLI